MEQIGYGGANNSMWTNDSSYFSRTKREDSLLGMDCLFLKTVCWMNPWATIEHIPSDFKTLEVYIYHVYKKNFRMNNKCTISMCNWD